MEDIGLGVLQMSFADESLVQLNLTFKSDKVELNLGWWWLRVSVH